MLDEIIQQYGIKHFKNDIISYGEGLINQTWRVDAYLSAYILQKVNQSVFKNPFDIDVNISLIKEYLHANHPNYLFISPISTQAGQSLIQTNDGYFRMFHFVKDSHSLNVLTKQAEAYEAAKQFGKFSLLLNNFDAQQLHITLPDFHNLTLRYNQFLSALTTASIVRKEQASTSIAFILKNKSIVDVFSRIVALKEIPTRVIHHDAKINNVLFDSNYKGICVIDLDTIMPGYFISDVGDMMRTYLSPVNEEETDFTKIKVRISFFKAIYEGYMAEMGDVLTTKEKEYFIYSGKFIIFMQALRFLTDFLENDVYYGASYNNHNLNRGENQLVLLKRYCEAEADFKKIIALK